MLASVVALVVLAAAAAPAAKPTWPSPERYRQLMGEDRLDHPRFRGFVIERGRDGRPRKWSGQFNSVFRATAGKRSYAVRVMHPPAGADEARHDVAALDARYRALRTYLVGLRKQGRAIPAITRFWFTREAITDGARQLPVVHMPWLEGEAMDAWVEHKLAQPTALKALAGRFEKLIASLAAAELAHGDLHQGNVFVSSSGQLQLMDFDSMYAPGLTSGGENGHPDFEHPAYHFEGVKRPFDARMDRFSSHVIYLSLAAVAAQPELWAKFHDEDTLLFQGARDLRNPDRSELFAALKASPDPTIGKLADRLATYAFLRPEQVPPLSESLRQVRAELRREAGARKKAVEAAVVAPAAAVVAPAVVEPPAPPPAASSLAWVVKEGVPRRSQRPVSRGTFGRLGGAP